MNEKRCGCCEGLEKLTPMAVVNRPGLGAIAYRVGTHAAFLETMKARLTDLSLDLPVEDKPGETVHLTPLRGLTTREASDPAIALLDAWATVADVLTFYQERIANEGYLRTATERRSVAELARLVGYRPRPGVAASVFLAFTLEKEYEIEIPAGTRAQSIPEAGQLPQSFETGEPLEARTKWNGLKPCPTRPQVILRTMPTVYLQGTSTNLKPGAPLLLIEATGQPHFRPALRVEADAEADHTKVTFAVGPAIGRHLVRLARLIQTEYPPEEEGPYSKAIGERAVNEIRVAMARLIGRLRQVDQSPGAMRRLIAREIPRLDQAARVLRALNLDVLASWVDEVRAELDASLRQLEGQPQRSARMTRRPVEREEIDRTRILIDDAPSPPSRKPFAREIGAAEMKRIQRTMRALVRILASDQASDAQRRMAAQAALLQLDQLEYVFDELGFESVREWIGTVRQRLAEVIKRSLSQGELVETIDVPVSPTALLTEILEPLQKAPSRPPSSALKLKRSISQTFAFGGDMGPRLLATMKPNLKAKLYRAWSKAAIIKPTESEGVQALRVKAAPFGHNAPLKPIYDDEGALIGHEEWPLKEQVIVRETIPIETVPAFFRRTIALDAEYDQIVPGSWVVIRRPDPEEPAKLETKILRVEEVRSVSKADFGISGKVTQLILSDDWLYPEDTSLSVLRQTTVYAQSETLALAEEPIKRDVAGKEIELDGLYDGLASGRWLIVSGERTDVTDAAGNVIPGIRDAELAMLVTVIQGPADPLPGETPYSTLVLSDPLAYTYKRDSVVIHANVARATHGETREEVLGSGDGSKTHQQFTLHQKPLTYLAAPTPVGAESTLEVRVDDVRWHEKGYMVSLQPNDHAFITQTDEEDRTTVVFGDGRHGARLPTGVENVRAKYRTGIGRVGNVPAEQISLLAAKPLGVKEVINPLPAAGGADREARDQIRHNVPLAMMTLDRLVSVRDYADFARTYAGIGKASAVRLPSGSREIVHVTIAGADDGPITRQSDLYRNLTQALRQFGDPYQPFRVDLRQLILLVISARVRLQPDHLWASVEPKIRAALTDTFSFDRRELGQDALYGEAVAAVQAVPGVAYVDVDVFDGVSEEQLKTFLAQGGEVTELDLRLRHRIPVTLAETIKESPEIRPAQLAILSPEVRDTLILLESDQ